MNINWKLRLKNKATLAALGSAALVFAYSVAGALGVTLPVEQAQVTDFLSALLVLLVSLGVVIDPTTKGIDDSGRALGYETPKSE